MALTKTAKKTRDHKTNYVDAVRRAIDASSRVYLFSYENMRSNHFKDVRLHFRGHDGDGGGRMGDRDDDCAAMDDDDDGDGGGDGGGGGGGGGRLFLGKNKLLQVALGRSSEDEYSDNLHALSSKLSGSVGILCTNVESKLVEEYFAKLSVADYARSGTSSSRSVVITNDEIETHPVSMVELFRKLGLPVEVKNGRVSFVGGRREYEVCRAGDVLSVEQCKILTHVGVKLSTFKIDLVCRWEKNDGAVEEF